jgi:hypothetical protein
MREITTPAELELSCREALLNIVLGLTLHEARIYVGDIGCF